MPKVGTCTHILCFLFCSICSHNTQSLSVSASSTSAHPIRWDYRKTLNDRIVRMTGWDVYSLVVRISDNHLKSSRKTWNAHKNNKWISNANWCMISCFFLIMMESVININDDDDAVICSVIIIVCIAYRFWNCYVVAELHWCWSHSRMHIQEISLLLFIQSINHNTPSYCHFNTMRSSIARTQFLRQNNNRKTAWIISQVTENLDMDSKDFIHKFVTFWELTVFSSHLMFHIIWVTHMPIIVTPANIWLHLLIRSYVKRRDIQHKTPKRWMISSMK